MKKLLILAALLLLSIATVARANAEYLTPIGGSGYQQIIGTGYCTATLINSWGTIAVTINHNGSTYAGLRYVSGNIFDPNITKSWVSGGTRSAYLESHKLSAQVRYKVYVDFHTGGGEYQQKTSTLTCRPIVAY